MMDTESTGYPANSVCAIMNVYTRTQYFEEQLDAILNQTIKPHEIIVWVNYHEKNQAFVNNELQPLIDSKNHNRIRVIQSNHNWKYHGRFAGSFLAQSEYVCVFDDDTIPGQGWFENCIKSMKIKNGAMGSIGEIYITSKDIEGLEPNPKSWYFKVFKHLGWKLDNEYDTITRVDVIGHSWFFRKEWLKFMWMEEPSTWDVCEDIQFCYCLQKYGGIYSYVPPQPNGDEFLCGSLKGYEYGCDDSASFLQAGDDWNSIGGNRWKGYYDYIVNKGYQLVRDLK
jgi:GT2 family glycosyltransferase